MAEVEVATEGAHVALRWDTEYTADTTEVREPSSHPRGGTMVWTMTRVRVCVCVCVQWCPAVEDVLACGLYQLKEDPDRAADPDAPKLRAGRLLLLRLAVDAEG